LRWSTATLALLLPPELPVLRWSTATLALLLPPVVASAGSAVAIGHRAIATVAS
jgi:hypothetical protein